MNEGAAVALTLATITVVAVAWPRPARARGPKREPTTPTPGGGEIDPRPVELDAFGVPFARGASDPLWPLAEDTRSASPSSSWARGRVSADFGDARPYGASSPSRHHAGEDLRAPRGSLIVATERGTVRAIDDDWYEGTGVLLVAFDSGITANFGEIEPSSPLDLGLAVGTVVERGQAIARVGATGMLHFELYSGAQRRTFQWPWTGAAPAELLDPTQYLQLAATTVPA